MLRLTHRLFRFRVYFSSKLNIVDACVVVVTLVVTMIYTFSDLSGASLIPRYLLFPATVMDMQNYQKWTFCFSVVDKE